MSKKIPEKMKCLVINEYGGKPTVGEVPVPKLKNNWVLIKVEAAPINPSDQSFMNGTYGLKKNLPCVAGFEGAGTVVATKGLLSWFLYSIGDKVSFIADNKSTGTFAEYISVPAGTAVVQPKNISFDKLSCAMINPLSILGMVQIANQKNSKAIVQTGATSAIGKMMIMYCRDIGIKTINIVRRDDCFDELKKLGADVVLNVNTPGFEKSLRKIATEMGVKVCFDAVGGQLVGQVINGLPDNCTTYTFGTLAMQHIGRINPSEIIFRHKRLEGFHLNSYAKSITIRQFFWLKKEMHAKLQNGSFVSPIATTMDMRDYQKAMDYYEKNPQQGKVIMRPKF